MHLAIGSDHAGFAYKEAIKAMLAAEGHIVRDFGTNSEAPVDYPDFVRPVAEAVAIPVIASGGVGNLDHLVAGIREGHATAVLAASIFHFGEFTIRQAKDHMVRAGLPMRLDP